MTVDKEVVFKPTLPVSVGSKEFSSMYLQFLQKKIVPAGGTHILIACMPKTASTLLSQTIARLPGFKFAAIRIGSAHREQELDVLQAIVQHPFNYVSQSHLRYSDTTEWLCRSFSIRSFVLVRDIFDVLVSIHDHIFKRVQIEPGRHSYFHDPRFRSDGFNYPQNVFGDYRITPLARIPKYFRTMPFNERMMFIVDNVMPWYLNFFVGWTLAPTRPWIFYDDIVSNPVDVVRDILTKSGWEPPSEEVILAAMKSVDNSISQVRRNKVVSGRGQTLPKPIVRRICRMCEYYAHLDFEPIGVGWSYDEKGTRRAVPLQRSQVDPTKSRSNDKNEVDKTITDKSIKLPSAAEKASGRRSR